MRVQNYTLRIWIHYGMRSVDAWLLQKLGNSTVLRPGADDSYSAKL